jgi:hypothetical protein
LIIASWPAPPYAVNVRVTGASGSDEAGGSVSPPQAASRERTTAAVRAVRTARVEFDTSHFRSNDGYQLQDVNITEGRGVPVSGNGDG